MSKEERHALYMEPLYGIVRRLECLHLSDEVHTPRATKYDTDILDELVRDAKTSLDEVHKRIDQEEGKKK